MGQKSQPSPPDYASLLKLGYQLQGKYAPKYARLEARLRRLYDPQRIAEQQALQAQYGPTQYEQQLAARAQLDPLGVAAREALGQGVLAQYGLGTQQDPAALRQEQQYIRAAQAARGNAFGSAPVAAEALYQGQRGQQLQQYRTAALGSFLAGRTPEQDIMQIQSVSPDRSSAYVNPQGGAQAAQFGLQNYPNQLAQNTNNPWMNAFGGALGGATAGASFGPYGALGGAVLGGTLGYFSDPKMKTDVKKLGNVPIYEYKYKAKYGIPGTFRGPMSTDVKKLDSNAVTRVLGHDFVRSPNSLGLNRVKVKED